MKNLKNSSKEEHSYDKYTFTPKQRIRYAATGAAIGAVVVWLAYQSLYALPLGAACAAAYVISAKKKLIKERRDTLKYHFRDLLSSLHTSLAAGYSLENAVRSSYSDMRHLHGDDDIVTKEMKNIVWQMSVQRPVEDLFRELGERSSVEDIRSFGEVLAIAKRSGGSMDKVMTHAWRTLSEKIDTAKEVDSLTAARRYEQGIMSLMPAGMIIYLKIGFPGFLDPLYGSAAGVLIMTVLLALYAAAFLLGRKMTAQEEI